MGGVLPEKMSTTTTARNFKLNVYKLEIETKVADKQKPLYFPHFFEGLHSQKIKT